MSIFMADSNRLNKKAFFDGEPGVQRYDVVAEPQIEKFNGNMLSNFWRPEEVDVTTDRRDFQKLSPAEQHIFTSNLKRQIVLDTVQGREPVNCFMPLASTPEMEAAIQEWGFQELIHSRSYTHIIRGVLTNPSEIFDTIGDIEEIVSLASDIEKYYGALDELNFLREAYNRGMDNGAYDEYVHKRAFYMALVAANLLEGIRFYVSFACSWAFMEVKELMEGNAKIIKLICRDENVHLRLVQTLLNRVLKQDPDFVKIAAECREECTKLLHDVAEQEKGWADYLFKDGSMLGLNKSILCDYVDWIADKRASAIGLSYSHNVPTKNPLAWTQHWIAGDNKQIALQEAENDSYLVGILKSSEAGRDGLIEEFGAAYT